MIYITIFYITGPFLYNNNFFYNNNKKHNLFMSRLDDNLEN